MNTAHAQATGPFAGNNEFVSSDYLALAQHMDACHRSRGRFFQLRSLLEGAHAIASPRVVTTGALLMGCCLGLLALA